MMHCHHTPYVYYLISHDRGIRAVSDGLDKLYLALTTGACCYFAVNGYVGYPSDIALLFPSSEPAKSDVGQAMSPAA